MNSASAPAAAGKVALASLGCPKNLIDAEQMLGRLVQTGWRITTHQDEADVVIINTCGFIDAAKRESIDTIIELGQLKQSGRCRALIVTGCLSQRYGEELMAELPEIDAVLGTGDYPRIPEIIESVFRGDRVYAVTPPAQPYPEDLPRVLSAPGPSAYLKIAEGCDHTCAFCVIPAMRGRHRSRPVEALEAEARALGRQGVRELVIVSQDTTAYGFDRYRRFALADLLDRLRRVEGIEWIRLHYCYPTHFTPELIELLATEPKLVKYLDVPLQHGSDRVLREMRRPSTRAGIVELVARLRAAIPGLVLRTSFIVGFPGETEEDFRRLLDLMAEVEFDHVGVFKYSPEEGTPAGERPDQVPEEVKEERYRRAMEAQQPIAFARNRARVGREVRVLVERPDPRGRGGWVGRWEGQAPGIDGAVYLRPGARPEAEAIGVGAIVPARVTRCLGYDLAAVPAGAASVAAAPPPPRGIPLPLTVL